MTITTIVRNFRRQALNGGPDPTWPIELMYAVGSSLGDATGGQNNIDFRFKEITGFLGAAPSNQVYGLAGFSLDLDDSGIGLQPAFQVSGFTRGGQVVSGTRSYAISFSTTDAGGQQIASIQAGHTWAKGLVFGQPLDSGNSQVRFHIDNINALRFDVEATFYHWNPQCYMFGGPQIPSPQH